MCVGWTALLSQVVLTPYVNSRSSSLSLQAYTRAVPSFGNQGGADLGADLKSGISSSMLQAHTQKCS